VLRARCTLALATLAAGLLATSPAAGATLAVRYSPFAPTGALAAGLRAAPMRGGACSTGSFVVADPVAFRCSAADRIYDPCYADLVTSLVAGPTVVCVRAPWARRVLRLRIGAPPDPRLRAAPGTPPWALRLASGRRCLFVQGARPRVRGRRLDYVCDGRRVLFGLPDRRAATWRIRQARNARGRALRRVAIAVAWG
jgi:hypothetical protein